MKEATGELNMTVITVVAIAAIAGLFYAFVWPMIQQSIVQNTCNTMGSNWKAEKAENGATSDGCTSAKVIMLVVLLGNVAHLEKVQILQNKKEG